MLEICVDDVEGVDAALAGGADRLELCSALGIGGLTPSPALVRYAADRGARVRAMIRPRAGGFAYSPAEVALMERDVQVLLDHGAEGIVVGMADAAGELDVRAMERVLAAARRAGRTGAAATLHRMIDLAPAPLRTLRQAADLGMDCVLSSGGAPRAMEGADTLAAMKAAAPPGLSIMAGAGVTPALAAALVERTGVDALHASARGSPRPAPEPLVRLGFSPREVAPTSAEVVAELRRAMRGALHTRPI